MEPARYERKFWLSGHTVSQAAVLVRSLPEGFHEAYPPRRVNNVYWDTPGLTAYDEHVQGVANRCKVRVRWYGETDIPTRKTVVEWKLRHGTTGSKRAFPFPQPGVGPDRETAHPPSPSNLGDLQPVLYNRYWRQYFCSIGERLRITLDVRIEFMAAGNLGPESTHWLPLPDSLCGVLLELKYAPEDAAAAAKVAQRLPTRLTRFSKYIRGVQVLGLDGA